MKKREEIRRRDGAERRRRRGTESIIGGKDGRGEGDNMRHLAEP